MYSHSPTSVMYVVLQVQVAEMGLVIIQCGLLLCLLQFHIPLRTQQAVVASARYRKPTEKPITIQ